jgi:hypothetical protein
MFSHGEAAGILGHLYHLFLLEVHAIHAGVRTHVSVHNSKRCEKRKIASFFTSEDSHSTLVKQ